MTIGTVISSIALPCTGSQTQFDFPFLIPFASNAEVAYIPSGSTTSVLLSPTIYQILGTGNPAGGSVTYPYPAGAPLPAGDTFIIARVLPLIQATSISAQGATFAAIETALDYEMMCIQDLQTQVNDLASGSISAVAILANIAALRAYSGSSTEPLYVNGYYNPADGGEGWFAFDSNTASDNGGTFIIDGIGRVWERALAGSPPTLKQFGAKGDGVTNDSAAVQNALNLGQHIRATPGDYIVAGLFAPSNVWLQGDGTSAAELIAATTSTPVLTSATGTEGTIIVSDVAFVGPGGAAPAGTAISFTGSSTASPLQNVRVTNCFFFGFTTSVNVQNTSFGFFSGLNSENCISPYINNQSSNTSWDDCLAQNAGGTGSYAFEVAGSLGNGNVLVRGLQAVNQGGGILGSNATRVAVSTAQITGNTQTAVSLIGGCSVWEITGSQLLAMSTSVSGLFCDTSSSNVTFAGNNVSGSSFGIYVGGTNIAVTGNVLTGNTSRDITIGGTGSTHINVTGNICASSTTGSSIAELTGSDYSLIIGNQYIGAPVIVGMHSSTNSYNAVIA